MASVASQVILHPVVSQSVKVAATTVGRDKLYRAVQYFARFLAWFLGARGYKIQAARWNALKSHLALGRKLMRLGKPVENLQGALRAFYGSSPAAEQILTIAKQLSYFGYLSHDALVWANTVKFFNLAPSTAARVNKTANRFWLSGILLSILHGLLKAGRLANEAKRLQDSQVWVGKGSEVNIDGQLQALNAERYATRHQFVIDLLDVWIPAASLGLVVLNEGLLGLFGLITSLMAFRQQWTKVNGGK
ncbi:hypothetical protein NLI96_g11827 [Meripilus lineatus]|uniref:Peroxisomal biogenesis factor 11 n=1 Tax=Meripilus lineatus TaxID=2056292 RepID=A0AAD5UV61_9APHY|nr:hypothetical protein NLI96_g11827 [Physisporinus lineatus]